MTLVTYKFSFKVSNDLDDDLAQEVIDRIDQKIMPHAKHYINVCTDHDFEGSVRVEVKRD